MNQPSREVELMQASEAFWDKETAQVREAIMVAAGYDFAAALDFSKIKFGSLQVWAQRAIARKIGESLAK